MRRLIIILTIALLLAGSALAAETANASQPAKPNPQPGGFTPISLSGQVVNGDGTPIPGATLQTGQVVGTADQQGNFRLSLSPGDYKLRRAARASCRCGSGRG